MSRSSLQRQRSALASCGPVAPFTTLCQLDFHTIGFVVRIINWSVSLHVLALRVWSGLPLHNFNCWFWNMDLSAPTTTPTVWHLLAGALYSPTQQFLQRKQNSYPTYPWHTRRKIIYRPDGKSRSKTLRTRKWQENHNFTIKTGDLTWTTVTKIPQRGQKPKLVCSGQRWRNLCA